LRGPPRERVPARLHRHLRHAGVPGDLRAAGGGRELTTSAHRRAANQPPPLAGYDAFSQDRALVDALRREGGAAHEADCAALGRRGGGAPRELGRLANARPPAIAREDLGEVEFHPAWHELLRTGVEHGLHGAPWGEHDAGAHVARAARFATLAYAEAGVGCPL